MTRMPKGKTPLTKTLTDQTALAFSMLFSPFVILPVLYLGAVWRVAPTPQEFGLWLLVAVVFFLLIPPAYIYNEIRAGRITDVHIQLREQRASVFLVFLASAAIGIAIYWLIGVPTGLLILSLIVFLSALIAAIITLFWKISIHAWTAAAAVTAFALLAADTRWWLALVIVPLVIWARLHRHRHSAAQGIAGAIAGILVTYLLYVALT